MRVEAGQVSGVLSKIRESYTKAVDTETTGLSFGNKAFSIQIATDKGAWYFDSRVVSQDEFNSVKDFLTNVDGELVFKNAKFDLHAMGIEPRAKVIDIGVLERLINNSHLSYKLKDQAKRWGEEKSEDVEKYIKEHGISDWRDIPIDIMEKYAVNDAVITLRLYQKMQPMLPEKSLSVFNLECELTKVCLQMEKRGVQMDREYILKALTHESNIILLAKKEFTLLHGVNYSDSKSVLLPIFKKEGCTIPLTSKGNPSLTDDVLQSFNSQTSRLVQTIRHYEKRISTYYKNFLDLADAGGRIHPNMRQDGTTTGRFSYSEPNFQNCPKEDSEEASKERFVVRGCIVPKPGHSLVSIDYSQQEYALLLAFAGEFKMIEKVNQGLCVHTESAKLFGVTRKQAKNLNFARVYGQGVPALAESLGVSLEQAMTLNKKYYQALPNVERFIAELKAQAVNNGKLFTWAGRQLVLEDPRWSYKMPNHFIQGGCADVVKLAMTRLKHLPMILQIHDEIVFEVPDKDVADLIKEASQVMKDSFPKKNGIRVGVKASVSNKSLAERDLVPWEEK